MKVLITGVSGFLGSNLLWQLKTKTDWEVWCCSRNFNFSYPLWFKLDLTVPSFTDHLNIKLPEFDIIYHLAVDYASPLKSFQMLQNVLNIFNFKTFIFASSIEAVGVSQELNRSEESVYGYNTNEYGKMKLLCEDYLQVFYPESIILRIGNVFGPGSLNFVYPLLCEISQGIENYISPIYIDDVVNALVKVAEKDIKPGIYNITDNPFVIVCDWAQMIQSFGYKYTKELPEVILPVIDYLKEGNKSHSGSYLSSLIGGYRNTLLIEGTRKTLEWLEKEKYIEK